MISVSRPRFEELVGDALDSLPPKLAELLSNVVVLVEDDPPVDRPELLGLYEGIPLTERGDTYSGVLPDVITIYRHPILLRCWTPEDVVDEVRVTVVHEVAHHFGIGDDQLHELGYG